MRNTIQRQGIVLDPLIVVSGDQGRKGSLLAHLKTRATARFDLDGGTEINGCCKMRNHVKGNNGYLMCCYALIV